MAKRIQIEMEETKKTTETWVKRDGFCPICGIESLWHHENAGVDKNVATCINCSTEFSIRMFDAEDSELSALRIYKLKQAARAEGVCKIQS